MHISADNLQVLQDSFFCSNREYQLPCFIRRYHMLMNGISGSRFMC